MAGKKATKSQEQPQNQETQTGSPPDPPSEDVNQRLARIEAAIEKMAARPVEREAPRIPSPTVMTTRGRAKTANKSKVDKDRRSVSMDPDMSRTHCDNFQSGSVNNNPMPQAPRQQAARNAASDVGTRDQPTYHHSARPDPVTSQPGDPFFGVNKPGTTQQLFEVTTPNAWPGWSIPTDFSTRTTMDYNPHSTVSHSAFDQDDVEQRVQDILASTASNLSRGNVKPGAYPFKYVLRGPERQKVSINSVSLSEQLWGLVCMIRDPKIDPAIRPYLNSHMLEIIEDSCEFEWESVRRWSEEVFTLINENRLPGGWSAVPRIQMLRMTISRSPMHKQYPPRLFPQRDQSRQQQVSHPQPSESNRNGPPCTAYNSPSGCPLPTGHVVNGRKAQHVCTFCLYNSCSAYTHPEVQCRNKNKYAGHHF